MQLIYLGQPLVYLEDQEEIENAADLLVLLDEIAGYKPVFSSHPAVGRLNGKHLRDLYKVKFKPPGEDVRVYLFADKGLLVVVHLIRSKRRTKLTKGQIKSLKEAIKAAKREVNARATC